MIIGSENDNDNGSDDDNLADFLFMNPDELRRNSDATRSHGRVCVQQWTSRIRMSKGSLAFLLACRFSQRVARIPNALRPYPAGPPP